MSTLQEDLCPSTILTRLILVRMKNFQRKSKHTFHVQYIFFKSWRSWNNVKKYGKARQATDDTMNNGTLPGDWKRATVISIHMDGDGSLVTKYRPGSLTSVVFMQMGHVIASYLRQVWDKNDWLHEGQRGFRPGYSCESQVITVC